MLTVPADTAEAGKLAAHYSNAALGNVTFTRNGAVTTLDVGEWKSEVATRSENDGTIMFVTISRASMA